MDGWLVIVLCAGCEKVRLSYCKSKFLVTDSALLIGADGAPHRDCVRVFLAVGAGLDAANVDARKLLVDILRGGCGCLLRVESGVESVLLW